MIRNGSTRLLDLPKTDWPRESSLILEEDTAVELGNPKFGSLFFLVWSDKSFIDDDQLVLIGDDLDESKKESVPFGQVIQVMGKFEKGLEYEKHQQLKRAVYETELEGFMVRSMPSHLTQWCRVSKTAMEGGFAFNHLGKGLIDNLKQFDFIERVRVIFISGDYEKIMALKKTGEQVMMVTGALIKLNEDEANHSECESCEFWDVCASVEELRKIRNQKQTEEKL